MSIEEKLRSILSQFDETVDVNSLTRESTLKGDLDMSSVSLLYMAVALEDEFGIDFANTDLGKFETVGDIIDAIEAQKK